MKQTLRLFVVCLSLAVLGSGAAFATPALDLANAGGEVTWMTSTAFDTAHLRVTGPNGFVHDASFSGEVPAFLAAGLADGNYQWSLLLVSSLSDHHRGLLEKARANGDADRVLAEMKASGAFASHQLSGDFLITGGQLIVPGTDGVIEPGANPEPAGRASEKDIVQLDDVIIQFSLCVGNDCVNGESFGFDTVRLKENNVRIHFQDTSSTASFPQNDWRIIINDSSNGGGNYFAIEDSTAGRQPFRVDAGAPANSLRVDSAGDVGMGTASPVVDAHIVSGNTPTLRLEQNGSSGFTAQTWDLAGNEANFFLRDVTNGSKLSFRAEPGAPQDSLFIEDTGDIGVGTNAPSASLHVRRTAAVADTTMLQLESNGGMRINMVDYSATGETWFIQNDANSNALAISRNGTGGTEIQINRLDNLDGGAFPTLVVNGTVQAEGVNDISSREAKAGFQPVDTAEVLAKLAGIDIQKWHYKSHDPSVLHMGPMAEDFAAAFGLGMSDKVISTVDSAGVALASIQALNERLNSLEQENAELRKLVQEMASDVE